MIIISRKSHGVYLINNENIILEKKYTFFILIVLAVLSNFSIELYVPSLPSIASSLLAKSTLVELSVTIYLLGAGIAQLVYGPLSDIYGRKIILIFGISIGTFGGLVCTLSHSLSLLLCGRLIQGCGLAACITIMRAIMRDCYSGSKMSQVSSNTSIFMELATILAPLIGGSIQNYLSWRMNFALLTLLSFSTLIIIICFFSETNMHIGKKLFIFENFRQGISRLLIDYRFIFPVLCSTLSAAGVYIFLALSPFVFQNLMGLTVLEYSLILCLLTGVFVTGCLLNSLIVVKLNTFFLLILGSILMLCAGILINIFCLHIVTLNEILVCTIFFMLGASFIFPNSLAYALNSYPNFAGSAAAVYGACQMAGAFGFTLIFSSSSINSLLKLTRSYIFFGTAMCVVTTILVITSLLANKRVNGKAVIR